ncbi:class I glutamine amidotransferase-like protein [Chaetomidium leptoderma]|uniref:Class I glutamine amidotransferase-like protein n=1 Tax=Chaetomidium leptoderma TaxID=669021 RepID=A0AAN6VF55_9PEZI|nr:class I glutamine amidotransferase-like protein [Chaetomidium leptoderma]
MPLRLAILEADTPVPAANERYKGYFGVFSHLLARAVAPSPLESVLTLTGHDVVHNPASAYPSLDDIDAILITGSKHDAFENDEWITTLVEFVRKALVHDRVRVVGVCFGHQIVARAMGTLVARGDQGWEVSVTETTLTPRGRELFGGRETLQMHRDQVFGIPAGAELLAFTDKCPNHGFVIPKRVITVQGHPEFTEDIMGEILELRHESGLFTDDVYHSGVARNGDHHDGVAMAQVFLDFLQEQ